MKIKILIFIIVGLFICPALAQETQPSDRIKELRAQFKARYDDLQAAKKDGAVGETSEGYVDFVKERVEKHAKVVADENRDRRELYKLIAQEEGTTADKVATRNAKRNFEKAKDGEYLQEDGKWKKKGEESKDDKQESEDSSS